MTQVMGMTLSELLTIELLQDRIPIQSGRFSRQQVIRSGGTLAPEELTTELAKVSAHFKLIQCCAVKNFTSTETRQLKNEIKAPLFGTTVVLVSNQGTLPRSGGIRSRVSFLGTFLDKQKGTKALY